MALSKAITNPNGASTTVHVLVKVAVRFVDGFIDYEIHSYKDAAYSLAGKPAWVTFNSLPLPGVVGTALKNAVELWAIANEPAMAGAAQS